MQPSSDKRHTPQSPSEHVGQRLSSSQTLELLTLLQEKGVVQGIGTPSRDEVLNPPSHSSNGLVALGGLFSGSAMDSLLVQMSVEIVAQVSNSELFDVSIRQVKMAPGSGFDTLSIAQVYPSAPSGGPVTTVEDFQRLLARYKD
jgi:hypothetical protein